MAAIKAIIFFGSLCYFAGGACGVSAIFWRAKRLGAAPVWLCLAGFLAQAAAFAVMWGFYETAPTQNAYGLWELLAWAIAGAYLIFRIFARVRFLGIAVCALAGLFSVLPIMCPVFSSHILDERGAEFSLAKIHGALALLSYAFMAVCAIISAMRILQNRALKRKSSGEFSSGLLPLPKLERLAKAWFLAAFFAMAASVFFGVLSAAEAGGVGLWKFVLGLAPFCAMACIFAFLRSQKYSPKAFTVLCLLLFAFSILILIPIQYKTYSL